MSLKKAKDVWNYNSSRNPPSFIEGASNASEVTAELVRGLDLDALKHMRLLEIGSGLGRIERALSPMCRQATGVDISEFNVKRAEEANRDRPNVVFIANNGSSLDGIQDASMDLVFSFTVFQHMAGNTVRNYVTEAFRVLRSGGMLRFQFEEKQKRRREIARDILSGRIRRALGGIIDLTISLSDRYTLNLPWSSTATLGKIFSISELLRMLSAAGFVQIDFLESNIDGFWAFCTKQ